MRELQENHASLTATWDTCNRETWAQLLGRAGRSTLEQSWGYGTAVAERRGWQVTRGLISSSEQPAALVQVLERRIGRVGMFAHAIRGPLWLTPLATSEQAPVLELVRRRYRLCHGELLLWMPELPRGTDAIALMRTCGKRQMVTGYSTIWLDLARDPDALRAQLRDKWRQGLEAAERSGLGVTTAHGGPELVWLAERHDQLRHSARFVAPSGGMIAAIAQHADQPEDVLALRAVFGDEPVAAVLLLRHGAAATYYAGWTGTEGRRLGAHALLLWRGMLALRDAGLRWLDLGGINATRAPGIARFKLGLGGEPVTLAGTFL